MPDQSSTDIAWAAGLFEGEGWWGPRARTSAEAIVGMTDRDVVERFAAVVGVGRISIEERAEGRKTLYRWSVCNAADVRMLIHLFWPWLGTRRRESATVLLERVQNCRGARADQTHCIRGHAYTPDNIYTAPGRTDRCCRTCERDRQRLRK